MHALSIKNLTKTYTNGVQALKGINLEVAEGDFFALLGANGAGKSTTIGITCSLVNKTSGSVEIFGKDIDKTLSAAKSFLGVVPQEFNFNIFEKVQQILVNQAGYYGIPYRLAIERAELYLNKLDLWEKRHQAARTLSGGMKRRLMIARALIHQPKLLILDEPTAGVDIEIRRSMWEFLQEINTQGTTIILTTHYLEEAESLCKNIAIIDKGQIIENSTMKNLLTKLDTETFIFDTLEPLPATLDISNFKGKKIDDYCLEIAIPKSASLNEIFSLLSNQNIQISSMRNKVNRLEELFVNLVSHSKNS